MRCIYEICFIINMYIYVYIYVRNICIVLSFVIILYLSDMEGGGFSFMIIEVGDSLGVCFFFFVFFFWLLGYKIK